MCFSFFNSGTSSWLGSFTHADCSGHDFFGFIKKVGPYHHLSFTPSLDADSPVEAISEGFFSVGRYFQSFESDNRRISWTLFSTNCSYSLTTLFIQLSATVESDQKMWAWISSTSWKAFRILSTNSVIEIKQPSSSGRGKQLGILSSLSKIARGGFRELNFLILRGISS